MPKKMRVPGAKANTKKRRTVKKTPRKKPTYGRY